MNDLCCSNNILHEKGTFTVVSLCVWLSTSTFAHTNYFNVDQLGLDVNFANIAQVHILAQQLGVQTALST